MGNRAATALSDSLLDARSIVTLDLSTCNMDSEGAKMLGVALQRQPRKTVTELNLSWNRIEDDGCLPIARLLGPLVQLAINKSNREKVQQSLVKVRSVLSEWHATGCRLRCYCADWSDSCCLNRRLLSFLLEPLHHHS